MLYFTNTVDQLEQKAENRPKHVECIWTQWCFELQAEFTHYEPLRFPRPAILQMVKNFLSILFLPIPFHVLMVCGVVCRQNRLVRYLPGQSVIQTEFSTKLNTI